MKTLKSLFVFSLLLSSVSLFAETTDSKKETAEQNLQAIELELLSDYIISDSASFERTKIEVYNSDLELVKEGEVSFDLDTPSLDYLLSQSNVLADLGHTVIYQLKR